MRAVVAVALLVGVYVLAFALIVGIIVADVLWVVYERPISFVWWTGIGAMAIFGTLGALISFTKARDERSSGIKVSKDAEPELWALVTRLAGAAGSVPPDHLYVVPTADVWMTQKTRMLGLIGGERRLFVGAPLVACMTERQLSFVLAHALGVHGNRDTRLITMALTGREALIKAIEDLAVGNRADRVVAEVFELYLRLYRKVTDKLAVWQGTAADANATKVVGSLAAESALREQEVVVAAWKLFHDNHFRPAWEAGFRPTTIFDAFARLRGAPELHVRLDEIRRNPTDETRQRIAAVAALGVKTTGPDRQAGTLLANAGAVMDKTLVSELMEELGVKKRVDWAELGVLTVRAKRVEQTRRIVRIGGGSFEKVLDTIDDGKMDSLLRKDLSPGNPFGGPRVRNEFKKGALIQELTWLAEIELVDAGHGLWQTDWLGTTTFHGPDLSAQIEKATDYRGSTAELRAALGLAALTR